MYAANKTFGTDCAITTLLMGESFDISKVDVDTYAYKLEGENYVSTTKTNVKDLAIGTYYIKVTGKASEGFDDTSAYLEFLVIGKPLTDAMVQTISNKTYTGSAITFDTKDLLKDGTTSLKAGTDYTAVFSKNINAGEADITFTGTGNYSGTVTGHFTIEPKAFSTATVTVTVLENEVTYDGTATQTATLEVKDKTLNTTLELGKDYTVTYGGEHKNVGNYTITVYGKGNYTTGTGIGAAKDLKINPATVLVAPSVKKTYDGAKTLPASGYTFEYTGFVDATTAADVTTTGVKFESSNANKKVGKYNLAVTEATADKFSTTSGNYIFTPVVGTFEIEQKDVTIKANDQAVPYGSTFKTDDVDLGAVFAADKDAVKRAVIVYNEGNVLKVKANDDAAPADKDVLANYKPTFTNGVLSVTKATITIALDASKVKLTKEYDGTPAAIAEDVTNKDNLIVIGKLISGDDLVLTGLKATVVTNTGAVNADPGYKVTLSGATVSANADKYTINYVTTYYKVTQKALTITIPSQSAKAGDAIATAFRNDFFTVKGLATDDEKDDIFVLSLHDDAKAGDEIADVESGNYILLGVKAGKEAVANNYKGWSGKKGMLVIATDASIILNRPSKDAFALDPTLDDAATVIATAAAAKYNEEQANAYNAQLDDAVHAGDPTGAKFDAAGALAYNAQLDGAVKAGDLSDEDYTEEAAAEYNSHLTGAVAAGAAAPADYNTKVGSDPVDATSLTAEEAIAYNKELDGAVWTTDKVPYTEETAAAHNAGLTGAVAAGADALFTKAGAAAYNAQLDGAVAPGDPISGALFDADGAAAYNAQLDGAVAAGAAAPADYHDKVGSDPVDDSDLTDEEAAAYNAQLDGAVAAGAPLRYTVAAANTFNANLGLAVAAGAPLCYTFAEAAAYNEANLEGAVSEGDQMYYDVTFGDFNMLAEKWYPVVLPFDTSVKEVSETFGYAIVNILNEDNTNDKKITFKLWMRDIPANTPFVVKVYQEKNMNSVSFDHKLIKNSTAPEVADKVDVKFIGSYSHKVGFKANEAFFSVSAEKNDYYWGSATNTTYMAPLSAYFQIPEGSSARTIEFQEADGSTTAIEIVGAEKLNTVKEGWYTINGMKLENAPVEKGIYINNGKKIVIK